MSAAAASVSDDIVSECLVTACADRDITSYTERLWNPLHLLHTTELSAWQRVSQRQLVTLVLWHYNILHRRSLVPFDLFTRLCLRCHIQQILMQLGELQLEFSNGSELNAGRRSLDRHNPSVVVDASSCQGWDAWQTEWPDIQLHGDNCSLSEQLFVTHESDFAEVKNQCKTNNSLRNVSNPPCLVRCTREQWLKWMGAWRVKTQCLSPSICKLKLVWRMH